MCVSMCRCTFQGPGSLLIVWTPTQNIGVVVVLVLRRILLATATTRTGNPILGFNKPTRPFTFHHFSPLKHQNGLKTLFFSKCSSFIL